MLGSVGQVDARAGGLSVELRNETVVARDRDSCRDVVCPAGEEGKQDEALEESHS